MARIPMRFAIQLIGRDEELARLDEAWNDPGVQVVTLVSEGGVGKTSLVAEWMARIAVRDEVVRTFEGSFLGQGIRGKGESSSDAWVAAALRRFGDHEMAESPASAWDKGTRLAELVAAEPTLLVLDGLETLQHPSGPLAGRLRDPAIAALLRGLADRNPGLCVVTTRQPVVDLGAFRGSTAPEWPLCRLSTPAGVALLRQLRVHGPEAELVEQVEEVRGHALTLDLLGRHLALAHGGDIRRRDPVPLFEADPGSSTEGPWVRVLDAILAWLGERGPQGARQLAVLRLLGLFDRPASDDCIEALRAEPAIPGLTEPLIGLSEADWKGTLDSLVESRLLAPTESEDTSLGTHPLIRGYFAAALRNHQADAWRLAHSRLFDHLRQTTEHRPDSLEGLQPLYQTVRHGCEAGRHQEACDDVYYHRILRDSEGYSARKLGAFGSNLGAIACFFDSPWGHLAATLSKGNRSWLLENAAFYLRALGRPTEAIEPMRLGIERQAEAKDWETAAGGSSSLSQLALNLGDVAGAVEDGERSLDFAHRSGNRFWRIVALTNLADAQHQAGQSAEALAAFREAEAEHTAHRPRTPLLYSLSGHCYCDLLLADAERGAWLGVIGLGSETSADLVEKCLEVEQRASQTLAWAESSNAVLNIAFDRLTLGRVHLLQAMLERPSPSDPWPKSATPSIRGAIDQAIEGFLRAGTRQHVPRALLTRALLCTLVGDPDSARTDLDEAWAIADRGLMGLHTADVQLHRARLFLDRAALVEARRWIEKHGYGRRIPELEDAESVADSWP